MLLIVWCLERMPSAAHLQCVSWLFWLLRVSWDLCHVTKKHTKPEQDEGSRQDQSLEDVLPGPSRPVHLQARTNKFRLAMRELPSTIVLLGLFIFFVLNFPFLNDAWEFLLHTRAISFLSKQLDSFKSGQFSSVQVLQLLKSEVCLRSTAA